MPSNAFLQFVAGTLPQGYCWTSPQQFYNDIIAALQGFLPGNYSTTNYGPNKPDPQDQDKAWIRTDNFGNFDGLYTFNGVWLRPHATPPSANERRIWVGTEADLWAYDGGDATNPGVTPPTDTTGAMWQVDHTMDARFPLGAGTLPSGAIVNVGDTGGEEKHTLLTAEMPAHSHTVSWNPDEATVFAGNEAGAGAFVTGNNAVAEAVYPPTTSIKINNTGSDTPHNNLPPYRGVLFIKRTARIYITVP